MIKNLSFFFGLLLFLIFFFLILFLVLVLRFFSGPASLGWSRWRWRCVASSRTAGAFLKEEAEDVQQKQDTHAVQVTEEPFIIVERQFVRHHFAYHISDAHNYEQVRVDEAHDDEERCSETRRANSSFISVIMWPDDYHVTII